MPGTVTWCAASPFPGGLFGVPASELLPVQRQLGLGAAVGFPGGGADGSYLVDSASSHMLVSKIKPCMSKYKHFIP